MTIAVASKGKEIARHFGHCEGCTVYYVENLQIIEKKYIEYPLVKLGEGILCHSKMINQNSGCACRFFANFLLHKTKVDVIVAGEVGVAAANLFGRQGIKVITGVEGEIEENVQEFIQKNITKVGCFLQV